MTSIYNPSTNTIEVSGINNTLSTIHSDINNINLLSKNINEYILSANITVNPQATLNIEGDVLKFNGRYALRNRGYLNINNSDITSVNTAVANRGFIRSYTQYRGDSKYTFNLTNSRLSYLGPGGTDSVPNLGTQGLYAIQTYSDSDGAAAIPPIINNNTFTNMYRALSANGNNDIVTNNSFSYNDGDTIIDVTGSEKFDNNELSYHTSAIIGYLVISWGKPTKITNNYIHHNTIGSGSGSGPLVWMKEGSGGTVISDNRFENNGGTGARIQVVGSTHTIWSYVENNTINDGSSSRGINILGNGYLGQFDVMVVVRNNTINGGYMGIWYEGAPYFTANGLLGARYVKVSNNTITGAEYGMLIESDQHYYSYVFNNSISGSTTADIRVGLMRASGDITPKFINTKYSSTIVSSGKFYDYKLLDVMVVDNSGNPINNATVTVTNNIDASYPSITTEGQTKTSFTTGSDGHTPLPSDPANSSAILDFYKTNLTQVEMSYSITATYGIFSNSVTVTPDATWYRDIPDTYQNTITIQLPIDIQIGYITGKITDNNNIPINGASITNSDNTSTISDINGNYGISNLLPGNYTLTVSKIGYETQLYNYTIITTETITKDFILLDCPTPICEFILTQL